MGASIVTITEHRDVGAARRDRLATQSKYMNREMTHVTFQKILAKFGEAFDSQVGAFLESLWTDSYKRHASRSNLCTRLDYNGFYSARVQQAQSQAQGAAGQGIGLGTVAGGAGMGIDDRDWR
jgi:hypothetical protein